MADNPINITAPSILIILMGSLGDVARGLGLVSHLKANRPHSPITWLVEPSCAPLVGLHPQIDQTIVFNRAWSITALWDLYQKLRGEHFDITLDLQRHLKSGFFSLLSGSKQRIGFHRNNAKELNWFFNTDTIPYFSDNLPKLDHYFKFLQYFGFPQPRVVDFGFSKWDAINSLPPLPVKTGDPLVAVVMGSRWETKNWIRDGYIELIQHILAMQHVHVALVGDRSQQADANYISESIGRTALINLVGKTSLIELTAVLKRSTAAVGPDSGPGHLAAAVGTPYVTLFGPTSPQRTAPYGCEHLVVHAELDCMPCYQKKCPERGQQCMLNISADAVMEKLTRAKIRDQGIID
jgi:lipopolysaccharide heptosyltransferase II